MADEAGRPVADAAVLVITGGAQAPGARRTARTDAQGRFRFENLGPEGHWNFSVVDERYARQWEFGFGVEVPLDTHRLPLKLTAYAPRTLTGMVADEAGQPAADVTVTLAREYLPNQDRPVQGWLAWDLQVTKTDVRGRFTLTRLNPGRVVLLFDKTGFARTLSEGTAVEAPNPRFTIRKGLSLHGAVVHDGKPVAAVTVKANTTNLAHRPMGAWTVTTDEEGRFAIENIPDLDLGGVALVFLQVDDPAFKGILYEVFKDETGKLPSVTLEAEPGINADEWKRIRLGRADLAEQKPFLNAKTPTGTAAIRISIPVELWKPGLERVAVFVFGLDTTNKAAGQAVTCEGTGTVTVANLPAGNYIVSDGNASPGLNLAPVRVALAEGQTLDVVLGKGPCTLRGRILTQEGPLAKAGLTCISANHYERAAMPTFTSETDMDGEYVLDGLPAGKFLFTVAAAQMKAQTFEITVQPGENAFSPVLPTGELEVRLAGLDAPPSPVMNYITVQPRRPPVFPAGATEGFPLDAARRAVVKCLPAGAYTVLVPDGKNWWPTATVTVKEGERTVVEVRRPENLGWLEGRIFLPDGRTPANVDEILLSTALRDEFGYNEDCAGEWRPGADGRYRIKNLLPGVHRLRVGNHWRPGEKKRYPVFWIPNLEIRGGMARNLDIILPESREARIQLEGETSAWPAWRWELTLPDGATFPATHFEVSEYRPDDVIRLPLGEYTVTVETADGAHTSARFMLTAGEDIYTARVAPPGRP